MTELEEVRIIEMQKKIENYILGRLSQAEIDDLWIEFLQFPWWVRYLEIEINLRALATNRSNVNT